MPNFLSWGVDQETQQFGAFVQLQPRIHAPQPDGTVQVKAGEPRAAHFTKEKIDETLAVAGDKSRPFWEAVRDEYPRAAAMHENKVDISSPATRYESAPAPAPALGPKLTV